jgi:CubicO group peptidase (beta-lactamase class C family)
MPQADTARWGDRLAELATRLRVPGAVLGIWAGEQESVVAHGVLNAATGVPVTTGSLFQIGSITKAWTATMAMQLIDEGRLSPDTTVSQALPGVRLCRADVAAEVTIRHLLTHTSGIDGDIFTDTGRGADCVERYVSLLADATTAHPLGAAYSYCNSGFVLLGRIIEVIDGEDWDTCLRRRLVEPLGLSRTVTLPEQALLHRCALGHSKRPRDGEPVSVWGLPRSLGPAGAIITTAGDLLRFTRLHLDGGVAPSGVRLLSPASVGAMRQPRFEPPRFGGRIDAIGLAWRLWDWDGHRVFGHDGSTVGQSAYLRIDPQARVAACLLTNYAASDALFQGLFSEIFSVHAGITPPAGPEPARGPDLPSAADLSRHVGRYQRTSRRCDVHARAGKLHLISQFTGDRARFGSGEPEEAVLYPADASGDNFVCRSDGDEPWTALSFGRLADQTRFLYLGGRITLRVGP